MIIFPRLQIKSNKSGYRNKSIIRFDFKEATEFFLLVISAV